MKNEQTTYVVARPRSIVGTTIIVFFTVVILLFLSPFLFCGACATVGLVGTAGLASNLPPSPSKEDIVKEEIEQSQKNFYAQQQERTVKIESDKKTVEDQKVVIETNPLDEDLVIKMDGGNTVELQNNHTEAIKRVFVQYFCGNKQIGYSKFENIPSGSTRSAKVELELQCQQNITAKVSSITLVKQ